MKEWKNKTTIEQKHQQIKKKERKTNKLIKERKKNEWMKESMSDRKGERKGEWKK